MSQILSRPAEDKLACLDEKIDGDDGASRCALYEGADVTDDGDRVQRDLDELREAVLDDWLVITSSGGDALSALQNSVSWRITRPLRMFRRFEKKMREVGFVPAAQLTAVSLARRLGERR